MAYMKRHYSRAFLKGGPASRQSCQILPISRKLSLVHLSQHKSIRLDLSIG